MPPRIPPSRISHDDQQWMAHALALARRAEALASPNPMVGAVLVRNKRVVGEGFHTYDGLRHAEILALEAAGGAARGATLYVNLEPCCHTGRTSPCTRALIEAGVARVVAAMPDPNPAVSRRGFRALLAAGIEVESEGFSDEFPRLNEAFATWITTRRPFVTLKSAMTLDGRLVLPRSTGKQAQRWITSEASRAEVQRMRHASDAILTGIGTVLADDPLLTDRTGLPRRRGLLRVVLDSRLRMSPRSQLARTAKGDVLVFTCASESSARARALRRAGVEVIAIRPRPGRSDLKPDISEMLAELGRRNILSVLLEAGATLNNAALDAGLVDKVRLFYAPILAGNHLPAHCEAKSAARRASSTSKTRNRAAFRPRELSNVRIERFGPDIAVEGYLRDALTKK